MQLIDRINQAFTGANLPPKNDLVEGSLADQDYAHDVAADLESWRTNMPDKSLLRQMHQELRKISPASTRWIVPYYLRYALTDEAKYSLMEVSFFVLSLVSRSKEVDQQVAARLSLMSSEQIACVVHVLSHLNADPDWAEYMGEDIEAALATLMRLNKMRGALPPER
ncbi:MAG: DUF6714 family protein [Leptothrix ochracea]|uniref:DUF6714 family protein n=1 Tax=Leptothrix ochracea TaxID=735331 RepID=UPI0034E1FA3F